MAWRALPAVVDALIAPTRRNQATQRIAEGYAGATDAGCALLLSNTQEPHARTEPKCPFTIGVEPETRWSHPTLGVREDERHNSGEQQVRMCRKLARCGTPSAGGDATCDADTLLS